jgi:hypothetical protein
VTDIFEKNPIPGAFKDYASHELDVTYLLQNLPHEFPDHHNSFGKEMAKAWIKFTCGEGWDNVMVLGPDEKVTFWSADEYDERFRNGRGKLLEEIGGKRGEKCFRLGEMLQGIHGERMENLGKRESKL